MVRSSLVVALVGLALAMAAIVVGPVPSTAQALVTPPTAVAYAYDSATSLAHGTARSLPSAAVLTQPAREGSPTAVGASDRLRDSAVAAEGVPETRVFWSGGPTARSAAEKWASENGAKTLEMSPGGQAAERATEGLPWSEAKPIWDQASSDFASGARETVHVFHNADGVSLISTWRTVEYPTLVENGVNMIFHTVGEGW